MANLLILILACSFFVAGDGLRIKRSESVTNNVNQSIMGTTNGTGTTLEATSATTEMQNITLTDDSIPNEITANGTTTEKTANGTTTEKAELIPSVTASSMPFAGAFGKVELILDDGLPMELTKLHHGKRRLGRVDEMLMPSHQARHRRHHGGLIDAPPPPPAPSSSAPSAPYVYYNKMVSPDGKHEVKEFEILAPNMMIESVQHQLNYGPDQDLGGMLYLNAPEIKNGRGRHHKHKPSTSVVPPMIYMLQHFLESTNNMDSPIMEPVHQFKDKNMHRTPMDETLYQFLDNAVDLALRNNHDVIEHLLGDHLELDHDNEFEKEKEKEKIKHKEKMGKELEKEKEKEQLDIVHIDKSKGKEDELIVSCPIHHEHHANKNGDLVDDDVVLVNECHVV
ncbi:uncharacterized protein Dwil_GK20937 [Drosophila willistoni]|uniref:DUF4794 domain-containing protein n=1 Tax=Drosophila willistoni TaxID=7260 RepID=B4MK43_DROWI|nr:uncharacterized protein LOC6638428 [Drosophila willistoni]EDW72482.2 uncharacterized protein Dwil_GK20937 [Drosophila willistoni]